MREIKFRGKRKDKNEWVYGGYMKNRNGTYICDTEHYHLRKTYKNYLVYSDTIGQYTGLKDKNGKEIYEGDKVNIEYGETTVENAVIEYCGASFYGSTLSDMWELDMYCSIEVIGNIYDKGE